MKKFLGSMAKKTTDAAKSLAAEASKKKAGNSSDNPVYDALALVSFIPMLLSWIISTVLQEECFKNYYVLPEFFFILGPSYPLTINR